MRIKNIILLLTGILLLFNAFAQSKEEIYPNRKKVAVVLSGGGAKGTAHIGVLKALERANIPIDIIVGTSMGALMGGLYSIGYDATMLDSLVRIQDWPFLLSDKINPLDQSLVQRNKENTYMLSLAINDIGKLSFASSGFIKGKNLSNLFARLTLGYHDSIDFNKLPIPFACVATDLTNFDEIVFHNGNLATVMRASMSIPAIFSPVYMDSMVLVDGGLRNNFPVDVAKKMGADIVIGVSVQNEMKKQAYKFSSAIAVVNQLIDIGNLNKWDENLAQTDIFIKVNVAGYSATSFNITSIDTLIKRGEEAAVSKWDDLMQLKTILHLDSDYIVSRPRRYHMANQGLRMKISEVMFSNIVNSDEIYLNEKFNLKKGESTTIQDIEKIMTALRTHLFYQDASYKIEYRKDGYAVYIESEGKKAAEVFMGVRFDNEEKVSLQFNATIPLKIVVPTTLQGTLRLGKRSMGRMEAIFNPPSLTSFTLAYSYRHQDINVYRQGTRNFNPDYTQHQFDFGIMNYGFKDCLFDVFARWNYYHYKQILVGNKTENNFIATSYLYSYHARVHYDDRASKYFANRGQIYEILYALYTDNLYQYDNRQPIHEIAFNFQRVFPISNQLVIEPGLYGRGVYGNKVPTVLCNTIGGHYFSHYVEQQMPFAGIGNVEVMQNNFVAMEINSRYRLLDNNYLSFTATLGQNAKKIKEIFTASSLFGLQISYAYNSIIGPIGASLGYSTHTNEPYIFMNIGYEF
ncbi:MAG: patatin-like phospholipase family protein [Bacteroidales bacterium]